MMVSVTLLLISLFLYGADINKLGDSDFQTRDGATHRLKLTESDLIRYALSNELSLTESPEKRARLEDLAHFHHCRFYRKKAESFFDAFSTDFNADSVFANKELFFALATLIDEKGICGKQNAYRWCHILPNVDWPGVENSIATPQSDLKLLLRKSLVTRANLSIMFGEVFIK